MVAALDATLAPAELPHGAPLVGTAGTVTTLAAVHLGLTLYRPGAVQGLHLSRAVVEAQLARYVGLTVAERRCVPGLDPRRADVIAGGCPAASPSSQEL